MLRPVLSDVSTVTLPATNRTRLTSSRERKCLYHSSLPTLPPAKPAICSGGGISWIMPANVSLQSGRLNLQPPLICTVHITDSIHTTATLQLCTTFHMNIMKEPGCCVDAKYPASFPRTEDTRPQTGDKDRLPDHKPEETCSYHSVALP